MNYEQREEMSTKVSSPSVEAIRATTIFWPDIASCYYSKVFLEWYKAIGVIVIPKDIQSYNGIYGKELYLSWSTFRFSIEHFLFL